MPTAKLSFAGPKEHDAYDLHVKRWRGCQACSLCKGRSKVVLYRGNIPCQILFVGEGPGESEDALGYPFVGPAGQLLKELWEGAMLEIGCEASGSTPTHYASQHSKQKRPHYGITNIVACWPHTPNDLSSGSNRPPTKDEAMACAPRLQEILDIVKPKVIICLGNIAERFLTKGTQWAGEVRHLLHPSAILHTENPAGQSLSEKRWVLQLAKILKEIA